MSGQNFQNGFAAYLRGDYETAHREFFKAAEQGDATAQTCLGLMYQLGQGISKDDAEAVRWYRKSAEQGDADAQLYLGLMYANGKCVQKDNTEAVHWYRKSAEQGNAKAQFNLGQMYRNSEGVQKDDTKAVRWFHKAAEQGDAWAQYNLGVMYVNGEGIQQDGAEAIRWFHKAAEQGLAVAQYNLGVMYYKAKDTSWDYIEAYKWFNLAAAQGLENAAMTRNRLQQNMDPSHIAQAQARTRAWRPSFDSDTPDDSKERPSVAPRETATWTFSTPPDNFGSGFFVSAEYILTNAHVIEGCTKFRISPDDGNAVVRALDQKNDLGLLQIGIRRCAQPALLRSKGAQQGENVVAAGYPLHDVLKGGLKVTTGIVSALSGMGGDSSRLQITAPVQKGNSGGPLLDGSGHVIGVLVETFPTRPGEKPPQNLNFAIRAEIARAFLDDHNVPYLPAQPVAALSTEQIAAMAHACTVLIECWE